MSYGMCTPCSRAYGIGLAEGREQRGQKPLIEAVERAKSSLVASILHFEGAAEEDYARAESDERGQRLGWTRCAGARRIAASHLRAAYDILSEQRCAEPPRVTQILPEQNAEPAPGNSEATGEKR